MLSSIPALVTSLCLLAQPVIEPTVHPHPEPVVIAVVTGDSRFEPVVEEVIAELRRLFRPSEAIPVMGLLEEAKGDPSILLWVGDQPPEPSLSSVPGELGRIWLDPIGWIPPPTGTKDQAHRRIAYPFETAVTQDLTLLLQLQRQLSLRSAETVEPGTGNSKPPPRVWVPVEQKFSAVSDLARIGQAIGVELKLVTIDSHASADADQILEAAERRDWVYFPPGSPLPGSSEARPWVSNLIDLGLASFSARGAADVHQGVFAARSGQSQRRLARLAALEALSLVRGLPPMTVHSPAELTPSADDRPVIHLGTAAELGITLPWRLRLSAELVGEPPMSASDWSLEEVRRKALEANLDLRARALLTAADAQQLAMALAALRPQVSFTAEGGLLDDESAEASFGSRPERLVTAVGEATWILFSEEARAAVDIARRLQAARELELEQLRLDIELEAASLLLAVARGRANEAVRRDHLNLTLAQLDEARLRRDRGAVGQADVARLEAKAARDRRALVAAYADRRELEIGLNRLLSEPLDAEVLPRVVTPFTKEPLPLEDTVNRPDSLARLQRSMLLKSQRAAPETAAAAEVVLARERGLKAAKRSFFIPTARGFGSWSARLSEGGAGTDPPSLPPSLGAFPRTPSSSWTFGLGLKLPIFTGGERTARQAEAQLELEAARALERRAAQQVEERVRLAVVRLETSYEAAFQARAAVQAAERALEVVEQGYAQGRESLTTWLDAQTELLSARLERTAARYDALEQWTRLQRASGEFFDPADLQTLETEPTGPDPTMPALGDVSQGEES